MKTFREALSYFFLILFIGTLSYLFSWTLLLAAYPEIDTNPRLYDFYFIKCLFPYFSWIARVITIIGLVSIVYTWIKQKNLFKKIVYSASIYFFSFYSASYFNPTIIAFSAYGMFSSWVVGLYGEAVKTKYADDFHWENFLKIQKKEPLNKVESLIGKPMNSYLDGNGNMLRIYSTNDRTWELTDDYWHIEVKYDKNEKVMGANLSYYFD